MTIAFERIWYAVSPEGAGRTLGLSIGVPTEYPDKEWGCEVSIGFLDRTRTIYGIDGWQAVMLGSRFAVQRLSHHVDLGWKFFWAEGDDPVEPEDLVSDALKFVE
ncbi:DUF6968 family protein [Collimonas sp.]|uniref:DUF6968 family protein n=1 Tax=Collimonas sp. TaxID=1963772 RepID=UPI002C27AB18|nr:hypothetical protein [Collimonas sp.]HWX03137.1 hypothetical protein [Collimonas sp.]